MMDRLLALGLVELLGVFGYVHMKSLTLFL